MVAFRAPSLADIDDNYVSGAASATVYIDGTMTICSSVAYYQGRPGLDYPVWETDLWERSNRSIANAGINFLQGQLSRARGAAQKRRIELNMMRLGEVVRRTT